MAEQLVLSINAAGDYFRWCWLDADGEPLPESRGEGDLELLRTSVGGAGQQAWLLAPGSKVVTRELTYVAAEKKHLRKLLPYQLEESVIGDIEHFHFGLGRAAEGVAAIAYTDRDWFDSVYRGLEQAGIEVVRCWPLPLVLPLPEAQVDEDGEQLLDYWTLQLRDQTLVVRYTPDLGFSVPAEAGRATLEMLLVKQNRVDNLPRIQLLATSDESLVALRELLPATLHEQVSYEAVVDPWALDYASGTTDLCQGEYSQRLPIERWWRNWRNIGVMAAASVIVYVGVLLYQVEQLRTENVAIRQSIDSVYRSAAGDSSTRDPEGQLERMIRELQPAARSGRRATALLAEMLPAVADNEGVQLRNIQYSASNGELNVNIAGDSFNALDTLRQSIAEQGLEAELLSVSASGDTHTARMRIRGRGQ
ncbi:type II secretion system protein GspL [Marinimicrobium alkaliphilum]|uniref:type II secretion system protein GspL n=1 Tax=Marinimicrobium alkaliphilum TaxID=2202654 RepID=UPI000DB9F9E1|nr:type II secretion system protein GspL [Marinimicrobium alkaliphilum]